ncbi:hypothetical protein [Hymenobacter latericus]|uniref:hypothetical protein n=1 Tax=Hymenobacter sp. YIM 151858-1 TaxID=2987688 RepID=UPI0022280BFF|nr:hypothetical protein [Hymenobacter sp. YIM 151858-1]UYZ59638.1 hypothetical protein OIS50_02295 [Hymenobacter sp. YIM 151858-1]
MRKLLTFIPLVMLLAAASCRKTGDTPTTAAVVDPTSPAAARAQLQVLRDSVDSRWKQMMNSDNQKLVATTAVLAELQRLPGANADQAKQLTKANERLLGLRYDQQTMSVSERIDAYDMAQDSVLQAVYNLAQPHYDKNQDVQALTETIKVSDSEVAGYRVRYDQAVKLYNNYIQMHGQSLKKAGRKYAKLQPLPLFELKY